MYTNLDAIELFLRRKPAICDNTNKSRRHVGDVRRYRKKLAHDPAKIWNLNKLNSEMEENGG